jgi:hypothetical protein
MVKLYVAFDVVVTGVMSQVQIVSPKSRCEPRTKRTDTKTHHPTFWTQTQGHIWHQITQSIRISEQLIPG